MINELDAKAAGSRLQEELLHQPLTQAEVLLITSADIRALKTRNRG